MPDLSKLSLDDLIQLRAMMMTLVEAGKTIAMEGHGVSFDLTPGRPARINTPFQMPNFAAHVELEAKLDEMIDRQIATIQQNEIVIEGLNESLDAYHRRKMVKQWAPVFAAPDLPQDEISPPAEPDAAGAAVEPAPAVALTAAGADDEPADALAKACADEDPDLDPVAPPSAVVVEPTPAARATAAGDADQIKPAPWTDDEDTRLVEVMAKFMAEGLSIRKSAIKAAEVLGRPEAGTEFRIYNKLKNRVTEAVAQIVNGGAVDEPRTVAIAPPPAPASTQPPPPEVPSKQKLPVVPVALMEVYGHLKKVTPFGKWTPKLDRDLIRLAEDAKWPLHEVCLELGVSSQQAQQRLSVLTKSQLFKRADVWAAMQAMGYGEAA